MALYFHYVAVSVCIVLTGVLTTHLCTRRIFILRGNSCSGWRKVAEHCALSLLALVAVAIAGNSAFDAIVFSAHEPPGLMYSVHGHAMRIDCTGDGSPTIVLDAGLGNDGLIWSDVQPKLAKITRVCSYDRAGFGWSTSLPPPRDANHIAGELHGLLIAAKVNDPVVLMGHSIAGLYIRDYATRYPSEVTGLIFVDSATPLEHYEPVLKDLRAVKLMRHTGMFLEQIAFYMSLPKLLGACPGSFPGFKLHALIPRLEGMCHEHFEAWSGEKEGFNLSEDETVHTGPYGALPILIFSRDTAPAASFQLEDASKFWDEKQEDLKKLSTHSRRIIAGSSGHYIHLDRPELLEKEVSLFVEQIRGTAPKPTNYGSTVTK